MAGRIFVSSTCYDLLDLRAEVEAHLRDMGLTPILSDRPSSEFTVDPTKDSIETCLVNVRDCDEFIILLCQRYGRSLAKAGFEDLSATHLEYREAKKAGKPIRMFVRDRAEAEAPVWNKATKPVAPGSLNLGWVKDYRVFELLEEHRKLQAGGQGNWLWTFRDSVDLRSRLTQELGGVSRTATLRSLLASDRLPSLRVFVLRIHGNLVPGTRVAVHVAVEAHGGPAGACELSFSASSGETGERRLGEMKPGHKSEVELAATVDEGRAASWIVSIVYDTTSGHRIRDEFEVYTFSEDGGIAARTDHRSKQLVCEAFTIV